MAQGRKGMSFESRVELVERDQDSFRESLAAMVASQEEQTAELRQNTSAIMIMCHKLDSSTEIGKKALDKVDGLDVRVVRLETLSSERIRNEKTQFIGMLVISAASIAAILKAFGVI